MNVVNWVLAGLIALVIGTPTAYVAMQAQTTEEPSSAIQAPLQLAQPQVMVMDSGPHPGIGEFWSPANAPGWILVRTIAWGEFPWGPVELVENGTWPRTTWRDEVGYGSMDNADIPRIQLCQTPANPRHLVPGRPVEVWYFQGVPLP